MEEQAQDNLPQATLARKERNRLSFQLGLPFGIFVTAVVVLLFSAAYIVQDRSSASTKIVPQTHADNIALRVEQSVERSVAVATLLSRLAGESIDEKNLEIIHTLINSDNAILSVSYVNAKLETSWQISSNGGELPLQMKMDSLPAALHFEKAVPYDDRAMLQTVHYPVYGKTGKEEGVLAVVYDISTYWELLADYTEGDAYIVDSDGAVLLRRSINSESTTTIMAIAGVQNFLKRNRVVSAYAEEDGTGMLSAWSLVRLPGWAVVVEEPTAALYAQLRALYAFMGFLIFIIVFLFVNEAIIVHKKIFAPLLALASNAQRIAAGEQNTWADTEANNEFDTVGEAMNTMARNVRTLRQGLEERIEERTEHLRAKTEEAERLNTFMVNRELRMLELKEQNRKLEMELLALRARVNEEAKEADGASMKT